MSLQAPIDPSSTREQTPGHARARRSRAAIVSVLVLSLLASGAARFWADSLREKAIPTRGTAGARSSLSNMNSFALGLLLGGLRGPLVMFLWTESETQKSDKNLEGVDTQIEWIRLLQPEFDTVHIFQIWNKAYNISVQMASNANKYSVILDALDYAKNVDRERPDDVNILVAMAQIYFDKLGGSTEKNYYRRRVRTETLPHPLANRGNVNGRRTRMDSILDENFNILPWLCTPDSAHQRPANLPADQEFDEDTDLQYLPQFNPYPDGVGPCALAYNYYKRAEVLQTLYKLHHTQLSEMVVDSRPALAAKGWAEEDWDQGRRREIQAAGQAVPEPREELEKITSNIPVNYTFADKSMAVRAVADYDHALKAANLAITEYRRTLETNPTNDNTYFSHMDEVNCAALLITGDRNYLAAILADPKDRAPLLTASMQGYATAVWRYQQLVLKYFSDASEVQAVLPAGYGVRRTTTLKGIEELNPQMTNQVFEASMQLHAGHSDSHSEDQQEYMRYMHRALVRIALIQSK